MGSIDDGVTDNRAAYNGCFHHWRHQKWSRRGWGCGKCASPTMTLPTVGPRKMELRTIWPRMMGIGNIGALKDERRPIWGYGQSIFPTIGPLAMGIVDNTVADNTTTDDRHG